MPPDLGSGSPGSMRSGEPSSELETPGGSRSVTRKSSCAVSFSRGSPNRVYDYVDADDLFVIALLHGRRRPGLYRGR